MPMMGQAAEGGGLYRRDRSRVNGIRVAVSLKVIQPNLFLTSVRIRFQPHYVSCRRTEGGIARLRAMQEDNTTEWVQSAIRSLWSPSE
jgi:hypothetical protein